MSEMEEEKSRVFGSLAAMPLYEEVKKKIFSYWCEANAALREINERRIPDARITEKHVERYATTFKASVLQLFFSVFQKFAYHKDAECVKRLRELRIEKFLRNPASLDLDAAQEIFVNLTEFLEIDGITRFERPHVSPERALLGELE